ncbi:MAG: methylmalonyl Co-A mutase-associated GTPase MeaB [Acidobacteriota bacterium]
MNLAEEILKGNPRAVAKGISLMENDPEAARHLMKEIYQDSGKSLVVGITGSPGSGKSTLLDQMVGYLRQEKKKIGIIAVDPSSPFSGGAILGDRIRMMRHSIDPEVFIRSMAARGSLGGLAKATGEAISVLEAAGKDLILVETVGVGQDEVEIVKLADLVLVVLIPGAGDDIQVYKAGIMEIADIFVLNKADSPDITRTERQLKAMLELGLKQTEFPPVIKTIATEDQGISELIQEINRVFNRKDRTLLESRRKRLIMAMLKDIISESLFRNLSSKIPGGGFDSLIDKIYQRETDPYSVAEELIKKVQEG